MLSVPDTADRPRLGAAGQIVLIAIAVLSILAGVTRISLWIGSHLIVLLVPPAVGIPELWPPLRFAPIGETSVTVWLIDLAGVIVMLAVAAIQLGAAHSRHPRPSRGRAFGRGVSTTMLAFIAGNMVRVVLQSFLLRSDLGTFAGQLLASVVITSIIGLLVGVLVGAIAALAGKRRTDTSRV